MFDVEKQPEMQKGKTKKTETPHDRTFKRTLRNHRMLMDLLRQYLPAELIEQLDLEALRIDQNEL